MRATTEESPRIAYCDCGAALAGDSDTRLFEAAQEHVVAAHPQLLLGKQALANELASR